MMTSHAGKPMACCLGLTGILGSFVGTDIILQLLWAHACVIGLHSYPNWWARLVSSPLSITSEVWRLMLQRLTKKIGQLCIRSCDIKCKLLTCCQNQTITCFHNGHDTPSDLWAFSWNWFQLLFNWMSMSWPLLWKICQ